MNEKIKIGKTGKQLLEQMDKMEVPQDGIAIWQLGQESLVVKKSGKICYFDPYLSASPSRSFLSDCSTSITTTPTWRNRCFSRPCRSTTIAPRRTMASESAVRRSSNMTKPSAASAKRCSSNQIYMTRCTISAWPTPPWIERKRPKKRSSALRALPQAGKA